jgi:hypothetical protein
MNPTTTTPTPATEPAAKLPARVPAITEQEQLTLDTFCKAKWAGKQAEEYYETVKEIISRIGKWSSEHGVLMPGESSKYRMPTLSQWQARLQEMTDDLTQVQEMELDTTLTPEQKTEVGTKVRAASEALQQAFGYTQFIRSYHETCTWITEMETFFKAAGIMVVEKTPNVKFMVVKAAPARPTAPKSKRKADPAEPVDPALN